MTYKTWERELKKELATISKIERDRTIEFYREMKDEKLSHGQSEEEITAEFGSPKECARRVGQANGAMSQIVEEEEDAIPEKKKERSAAEIVGLVFVTLILVLPLLDAAIGVLAAFAGCCVGGIGVAIAGVAYATVGPFYFGVTGSIIPAYVGMGLAATGVGILMFIGFMFATKFVALAIKSVLRAIYVRR